MKVGEQYPSPFALRESRGKRAREIQRKDGKPNIYSEGQKEEFKAWATRQTATTPVRVGPGLGHLPDPWKTSSG